MAGSSPPGPSPPIPRPRRIPDILPAAVHHEAASPGPRSAGAGSTAARGAGRGSDDFVDLPWDEALDIAAAEIDRIRKTHGNEAIFGGSYGWGSAGRFHHAQSQVHRFLNCIGGYVASFGSYSTGCAQAIMPHVFGVDFLKLLYEHQDGWQTIHDHTETLVMFGGINPRTPGQHGRRHRARNRGLVRPVRGQGHALHQYRPAAPRRARGLRLDARAARPPTPR
jgi:hypothetical protein